MVALGFLLRELLGVEVGSVVDHVELGEELTEDGRIEGLPQAASDQMPVDTLETGHLPQIAFELLLLAVGEEEVVDDEHQDHSHGQIEQTQLDGLGLLQGEGGHGEGKGGGEDGMYPGARCAAVHERDHHQGEEKDACHTREVGVDQVDQQAADGGADGAGDHTVGAVLITGLEQQKGVEGEPVGVLKVPEVAHRGTDGHDQAQLEGKAELEAVHRAPLPEIQKYRPPGNVLPGKVGGGNGGLLTEEADDMEYVPIEDTQTALGQVGVFQLSSELCQQSGPFLGGVGPLTGVHRLGQGVEGLGKDRGGGAVLPALVGHQIGGALVKKGQKVVAVSLWVGGSEEPPPGVAQMVELLGGVVEFPVDGLAVPLTGHLLHKLGEPVEPRGDLEAGIGGAVPPGTQQQCQQKQCLAEGHRAQLEPQLFRLRRAQLQEDKGHGKAQMAFGIKLAALPDDQEEEDAEVQQDTQDHIACGEKSQETKYKGNKKERNIRSGIITLLMTELEQGGGTRDHHGKLASKNKENDQKLDDIKDNGGEGGDQARLKGVGQFFTGAAGLQWRSLPVIFVQEVLYAFVWKRQAVYPAFLCRYTE